MQPAQITQKSRGDADEQCFELSVCLLLNSP